MIHFSKFFKFFAFIILISFVACKPDDPTPNTGDIRDKLVSSWKCQENSATYGSQNYYVDISKDTVAGLIIIDNFFNLGLGKAIKANVSGQTITIHNQMIDGNLFNGSGTVSSNFNSISWSYTFDEGNGAENVSAVYTKM